MSCFKVKMLPLASLRWSPFLWQTWRLQADLKTSSCFLSFWRLQAEIVCKFIFELCPLDCSVSSISLSLILFSKYCGCFLQSMDWFSVSVTAIRIVLCFCGIYSPVPAVEAYHEYIRLLRYVFKKWCFITTEAYFWCVSCIWELEDSKYSVMWCKKILFTDLLDQGRFILFRVFGVKSEIKDLQDSVMDLLIWKHGFSFDNKILCFIEGYKRTLNLGMAL